MHVEQHQIDADPQTKPIVGCEFASILLSSTLAIAVYYYSARKLIFI